MYVTAGSDQMVGYFWTSVGKFPQNTVHDVCVCLATEQLAVRKPVSSQGS
jgi:hypothetical protein